MPVPTWESGQEVVYNFADGYPALEIFAERSNVVRQVSGWLDRASFTIPSTVLEYVLRPGMILAKNTSSGYYVPWTEAAAYGAGSSTAVGVLGQEVDLTLSSQGVAPVVEAKLIEAHCYVTGQGNGSIPAAVKTTLSRIVWV